MVKKLNLNFDDAKFAEIKAVKESRPIRENWEDFIYNLAIPAVKKEEPKNVE